MYCMAPAADMPAAAPSPPVYRFAASKRAGVAAEQRLDAFFGQWFAIQSVPMALQRLGVDRLWTDRSTGAVWSVEIKADERAAATGNAFIEIQSCSGKYGWARTSVAQLLCYYLPPAGRCLLIDMAELKRWCSTWAAQYPRRQVQNAGPPPYQTTGLLVPLDQLEPLAFQVLEVE